MAPTNPPWTHLENVPTVTLAAHKFWREQVFHWENIIFKSSLEINVLENLSIDRIWFILPRIITSEKEMSARLRKILIFIALVKLWVLWLVPVNVKNELIVNLNSCKTNRLQLLDILLIFPPPPPPPPFRLRTLILSVTTSQSFKGRSFQPQTFKSENVWRLLPPKKAGLPINHKSPTLQPTNGCLWTSDLIWRLENCNFSNHKS